MKQQLTLAALAALTAITLGAAVAHARQMGGTTQRTPPAVPTTPAPASAPTTPPLNLNTATAAELEKLPGVGPAVAARILEYRQKNGGFKKIEDLMNVRGIGEKSFLRLKPLITVAPPKTTER
jgi:competence protein ComEA